MHMQVNIEIPFAFRALPVQAIESTGAQVLNQILGVMLPRFMAQVCYFTTIFLNIFLFQTLLYWVELSSPGWI